ncbi:PAS domain S-box protein [bacterium]|nr:PAS domain S-box protein [bacterium]
MKGSAPYKELIDDIHGVIVFLVEPDEFGVWRIQHASKQVEVVTDCSVDQIVGKKPLDLYPVPIQHLDQVQHLQESWDRCIQSKKPLIFSENLTFSNNKSETWWQSTLNPILNEEGEVVRIIYCAINITEQRKIEQLLRQSEQKFKTIVNDQTEMIVRWQPGGIRTFVNKAYCKEFGLSMEEAIGTSFYKQVNEEYLDLVKERIENLSLEQPVSTASHMVKLDDGSRVWQEWTDRAFFDEDGEVIDYQSTGRNITDMVVQNQKTLEQVYESVESERSRIAADIHDGLGQKLTAALFTARSLFLNEQSKQGLKEELVEILKEALDESRTIARSMIPKSVEEFGLEASLRDLMSHTEMSTGIKTEVEIKTKNQRLPIMFEKHLFRIAQEAVTNAIKHAEASTLSMKFKEDEHSLWMQVKDDGIGIDIVGKEEETTLGLRSIENRINLLNGSVNISRNSPQGTTVDVKVPLE